jgi:hypothetical protein
MIDNFLPRQFQGSIWADGPKHMEHSTRDGSKIFVTLASCLNEWIRKNDSVELLLQDKKVYQACFFRT